MTSLQHHAGHGFVGREREIAALTTALDAAATGRGGVVLLAGEPGIGKTRTAEEVSAIAAARQIRTLWGRCYEGEGAPAFWPWVQILRGSIQGQNAESLRRLLGAGASTLARLLPELQTAEGAAPPQTADPQEELFLLFDRVTSFLTAIAWSAPLLIVLDDLHWADAPSLRLLQFLARELAAAPLLVVGTYRDIELTRGDALTATLAELARVPGTSRLQLRGLAEEEVAQLLEALLGAPASPVIVSAVQRQTEGNAFFVAEVARLLAGQDLSMILAESDAAPLQIAMPATVRDVIGRRLSPLSDACIRLLEVAAVIGREFPPAALRRVLPVIDTASPETALSDPGERLLSLLEEAERGGIIADVPDRPGYYRFGHILIREMLYDDLLSTRRVRLHRLVGEALESLFAADLAPHFAELAPHFAKAVPASDPWKAVAYAQQAGDHAVSLYSYAEAAAHYRRALQFLDVPTGGEVSAEPAPSILEQRCDLLLRLGEALRLGGEMRDARQVFIEAAALARRLASPERLARSALGVGPGLFTHGELDTELIDLLEEALAAVGERDSAVRSLLLTELATAVYYADGHQRSLALGSEALEIAERVGDLRAAAQALRFHQMSVARMPVAEHLAIAEKLQRLAQETANPALMFQSLAARIVCHWELGNGVAAAGDIATYIRQADELRQPAYQAQALIFRTAQATFTGAFAEAEELAQQWFHLGPRTGRRDPFLVFAAQIFLVRLLQGRHEELISFVQDFVTRSPSTPVWRCTLAYLYAERGQIAEARAELEQIMAHDLQDLPADTLWLFSVMMAAETAARVDDATRARSLYDRLLPYTNQCAMLSGTLGCVGAVDHTLGVLAAALERWDDARRHFDAACRINETLGARPWLARSRLAYGAMLLAHGEPDDQAAAWTLVQQAAETAQELGMTHVVERARSLLDRPAAAPTYPDGLTAREAAVLRLIALGRTTREIAGELMVSDATVERHITNLYGKIGARNRADAAAYAHRQGLA